MFSSYKRSPEIRKADKTQELSGLARNPRYEQLSLFETEETSGRASASMRSPASGWFSQVYRNAKRSRFAKATIGTIAAALIVGSVAMAQSNNITVEDLVSQSGQHTILVNSPYDARIIVNTPDEAVIANSAQPNGKTYLQAGVNNGGTITFVKQNNSEQEIGGSGEYQTIQGKIQSTQANAVSTTNLLTQQSIAAPSAQTTNPPSLTFGPNPVLYGTPDTVTATCSPNTDQCAVQESIGVNLCEGTGSCTYNVPQFEPTGSQVYYAVDITTGQRVSGTLQVNPTSSTPYYSPTYGGATTVDVPVLIPGKTLPSGFFINSSTTELSIAGSVYVSQFPTQPQTIISAYIPVAGALVGFNFEILPNGYASYTYAYPGESPYYTTFTSNSQVFTIGQNYFAGVFSQSKNSADWQVNQTDIGEGTFVGFGLTATTLPIQVTWGDPNNPQNSANVGLINGALVFNSDLTPSAIISAAMQNPLVATEFGSGSDAFNGGTYTQSSPNSQFGSLNTEQITLP